MAEHKSKLESVREWVVQNKLRTVGSLWLSGIAGSIAYNWSQPGMKTSVKIIHARSIAFYKSFLAPSFLVTKNGCLWLVYVVGDGGNDRRMFRSSFINLRGCRWPPKKIVWGCLKPLARRLHAQALTLAALAGAAVVEYYDHKSGSKTERYAKFLPADPYAHKD
ncbi:HIG1 domain-containing protein [Citrus sinensis]|nr:HIG1 domain-containing protein [Citrus sinensis]